MTREFSSLRHFAEFMIRTVPMEMAADIAGRTEVAYMLTREVRARIGQPDKLPPPLAASTQERRSAKGFSSDQTLLASGALLRSIGWAHESRRKTVVGSTDEKSVWHEMGPSNGKFPARPFLRTTLHEKDPELYELYVKTIKGSLSRLR